MPNLICGKAAVGGNYNSTHDRIGLETDIRYNGNIMDTIENSKNVILWIIKKHIELTNDLKLYKIREGKGIYILEKK